MVNPVNFKTQTRYFIAVLQISKTFEHLIINTRLRFYGQWRYHQAVIKIIATGSFNPWFIQLTLAFSLTQNLFTSLWGILRVHKINISRIFQSVYLLMNVNRAHSNSLKY